MISTEVIKQAVEANSGVAVLAQAVAQRDVGGGHLRALAMRGGDLTLWLAFAYHRERADSSLLRAKLDVMARRACANTPLEFQTTYRSVSRDEPSVSQRPPRVALQRGIRPRSARHRVSIASPVVSIRRRSG